MYCVYIYITNPATKNTDLSMIMYDIYSENNQHLKNCMEIFYVNIRMLAFLLEAGEAIPSHHQFTM